MLRVVLNTRAYRTEFDVYLTQYGDPRVDVPSDELLDRAAEIGHLGHGSLPVAERHFYEGDNRDPFACLTAAGATTDSIDLVSNILIPPAYHQIHLAERIANADRLASISVRGWVRSAPFRLD